MDEKTQTTQDLIVLDCSSTIGKILGQDYENFGDMKRAIEAHPEPAEKKTAQDAWHRMQVALKSGGCYLFATKQRRPSHVLKNVAGNFFSRCRGGAGEIARGPR